MLRNHLRIQDSVNKDRHVMINLLCKHRTYSPRYQYQGDNVLIAQSKWLTNHWRRDVYQHTFASILHLTLAC